MASSLTTNYYGLSLTLLLSLLSIGTYAAGDPTRPPMEVGDGVIVSSQSAASAPSKGLVSVIMSPERCAAIIDGKTIRLGEKYGDSILVEVKPHGVVLLGKQGRRGMELFPGVGVKVTSEQSPLRKAVTCKFEGQKFENSEGEKVMPRQTSMKEKK